MNAARKILAALLIIPLGTLIFVSVFPEWESNLPGLELFFLIFGLPILILNYFVWFQPASMEAHIPLTGKWLNLVAERGIERTVLISVVVAFAVVAVGVVSAVYRAQALGHVELSGERPAEENVAIVNASLPSRTVRPVNTKIPSTPTATEIPESVMTQRAAAIASATPTSTASTPVAPTSTVQFSDRCEPATEKLLNPVQQAVESFDDGSSLGAAWVVRSDDQDDLWFVAARVHGPGNQTEASLPAVWSVLFYDVDYFDIYSINAIAIQYSDTALGEGSVPAMTMQSDGAQEAYDCALIAN